MTRLSIIIPSHSRVDLLSACLGSVIEYAPAGTEIIVVDDASSNGSVSATAQAFADWRIVRLARQSGFCVAVNAGLASAQGDVVEVLNDDTEVMAGWAEAALRWFQNPRIGAVAPLVLAGPLGETIESAGDRYYIGGIAAKHQLGERPDCKPSTPRSVFGASGASAFYRRQALIEVGGFPEDFIAYFDDVDVAFRLQRAGWGAIHEPASRVRHHGAASHGRPTGSLLEQQSCNEERVFWRNLPSRELVRALPSHLAVVAAKAWRRWREGELGPFVRGRMRVLREFRQLLAHRRRLRELGPDAPAERWSVERRRWTDHARRIVNSC